LRTVTKTSLFCIFNNMRYFLVLALAVFANCKPHNGGRYISILETKIYYEEHGNGPPLIILSGGGLNRSVRDFDQCVPKLSTKFRVILPDSPGQGKSEQPDTLSYEILTDFFSLFIDSLHLGSVYVMGWSDGGIVALLLAERKSDKVKKVLAVGANNGLIGALPNEIDISTVKPQALDIWGKRNSEWVDAYSKELNRDWKKMMNSLNGMWYQEKYFSDAILRRIRIPVMITQGDRDDIKLEHAIEMHRIIPNRQLCILPNTTHEVFSERPALISTIATEFFK
jgi:pimeloyl-ACP methyl ester carboxylesterase